jgi:superfamily II DNA or RNA helicase
MGVAKALVVSATGSGKTYLAAFDARNYDARRLLFVVHRDKILLDAKETFMKIFGVERTYGLYVGKYKEVDCDFLFASNVMLAQHLNEFSPDEFDYIVMDECHHAAASTYKTIIDYFKPGFMLGITATPERMDNQDVFKMFDKNVPYELRLRDAIINDLVVPFHYYGIRDKFVDYGFKDNTRIAKEIVKVENINFIKSEIEKHRPVGKLKALAFCTSIAHAQLMAEEFEEIGYNAIALTGSNDLGQRIKAFNDLQDDNHPLEIICAIDILNEGVDIPAVNMVLFLRPTESSTIFLQQLGRGLRKYEGKQYVTVLDFIGNNYDRSIQMAMALGTLGQSTIIEKPYLVDLLRTDFNALKIPGVIIEIDALSKEEIIDYIKNQNFNTKDFLKKDYENFKIYLKKDDYPLHIDYLNNDCAPDLMRLIKSRISGRKNMSYYVFLQRIGEKILPIFTKSQIEFINKVSDLLPIVRVDEYIIIKQLIETSTLNLDQLIGYNTKVTVETLNHASYLLNKERILVDNGLNDIRLTQEFVKFINDLISYGLARYDIEFSDYEGKFKLFGNYYKEQIMMVLLQKSLMFMKGTKFDNDGNTYIFVGLKKDKDKQERTNYKDKFLSSKVFQWESENYTTKTSAIGQRLINTKVVHLFVRKMDEEDGITLPFTYFGTGKFTNMRDSNVEVLNDDGTKELSPTLLFDIILDNKVDEEYYFDFEIPNDVIES